MGAPSYPLTLSGNIVTDELGTIQQGFLTLETGRGKHGTTRGVADSPTNGCRARRPRTAGACGWETRTQAHLVCYALIPYGVKQ